MNSKQFLNSVVPLGGHDTGKPSSVAPQDLSDLSIGGRTFPGRVVYCLLTYFLRFCVPVSPA